MRDPPWHALRQPFFQLVRGLGEFDDGVLATQARLMQDEIAGDQGGTNAAFFSLFDLEPPADLKSWSRIADPVAARSLLLKVLNGPTASAFVAAKALATHPAAQRTAQLIEEALPFLCRESVLRATWALLSLVTEPETTALTLAKSPQAGIREAVARIVPTTDKGRRNALAELFAHDPNRHVRLAAVERARQSEPSQELFAFLDSIAQAPDPAFACHRCGTENSALSDSCSSCRIVTNRPSKEAADLVESLRKGVST